MSDITKSNSQKKNQIPQTKNDTKTTNYSYLPKIRSGYIMLIPAISLVLAGFLLPKNNTGSNATIHDLSMSELQDIKASIDGQVTEIDPSSSDDTTSSNDKDSPNSNITSKSNTEFNVKQNNSTSSVSIKSSTTIKSNTDSNEYEHETSTDSSVYVNGQQINLPTEERFSEKYETEDSQVRLRGKNNNGSSSIDISIDSN